MLRAYLDWSRLAVTAVTPTAVIPLDPAGLSQHAGLDFARRRTGVSIQRPAHALLVLSERGFGKRTPIAEYPTHHRGGQGVFTLKVTDKVGRLAALRVTDAEDEEILLISASGMVLRTAVGNISRYGRQTQGVIVMRLAPDDQVVALAPVGVEMDV